MTKPPSLWASFRKPFDQQVTAFRLRLTELVPTAKWDDLWKSQHDRAFMVAGAAKADLLADLAMAVDKAVTEGVSLEQFRKDFRSIVERNGWHGWTGEGTKRGEAWRTKVIYKTNMRTSYAAGRWAQITANRFPLIVYRHGGSVDPRPEHLSWDGLILSADHPFWATHAPPNGWGCSCYVAGARTEAGAVRLGGKPGKALPGDWNMTDTRTGAPFGIDRGWDYAPGATISGDVSYLANRLNVWPYLISKAIMRELPVTVRDLLGPAYRSLPSTQTALGSYVSGAIDGDTSIGAIKTLGILTQAQQAQLKTVTDVDLATADFAIDMGAIRHVQDKHSNDSAERKRGQRGVTIVDWMRLLQVIESPDEILLDGQRDGQPIVRYVKAFPDGVIHALFAVRRSRDRVSLVTMYVRLKVSPPRATP